MKSLTRALARSQHWRTRVGSHKACVYIRVWGLGSKDSAYLCEIEDVRVRDCEQSVDCTSEGIDLLVWVPHEDFPTWLRQNYVHDRCDQEDGK